MLKRLKNSKNILLGQITNVYTDHKNVTYKTHNSAKVMGWRLLIKEFGPDLHYLPGKKNVVADCLSILEYEKDDVTLDPVQSASA